MVLCRNWIPGRPDSCRFGGKLESAIYFLLELTYAKDRCRFEHPQADRSIASNNPFAPLQRDHSNTRNNNGYRSGDGSFNSLKNGFNNGSDSNGQTLPYGLDKNQIFTDLSTERPQWILSAYGPGRNAPEQLFGGPMRERSFEEMRLLHYIGMLSGNSQQAVGWRAM
jgi:nucleoporin NUP42